MKMKHVSMPLLSVALLLAVPSAALAHVTVRPAEVGVGKFQTFTVGVPNERESATTSIRLVMPEGLGHVSPNVKPGWTIEMKRSEAPAASAHDEHQHAEGPVTEITWSGGSIPVGQRDEFLFSAQVPASETTLQWKAYQTYADGSVVAWDMNPQAEPAKDAQGNPDFSKAGPLSETKVMNDLAVVPTNGEPVTRVASADKSATYAAYAALLLSAVALGLVLKDKLPKRS